MEAGAALLAVVLAIAASSPTLADVYRKVYLDDPSMCNMTLRLHHTMPAVLVQLSSVLRPLTCFVQLEVGASGIVGLTAVVQDLNVGKFDDRFNCTSYLQVTTFDPSNRYVERLCGQWSSSVHRLEVRRSLFGTCDPQLDSKHGSDCAASQINLLAHVQGEMMSLATAPPSFTVVVTAYFNPKVFGGCGSDRFRCANGQALRQTERCIDHRLVCDRHANCGFIENEDEYSSNCNRPQGPITESDHFFATWAGFAVIVLLLVVAVSYFIRSVRWTTAPPAEEASRVRPRPAPTPTRPGAPQPPPYEALYPHGPPVGALEKKRQRAGVGADAAEPLPEPCGVEAPARHAARGGERGAAVTRILVEPEQPPPYSERPALRHSVLLAEAVVGPG